MNTDMYLTKFSGKPTDSTANGFTVRLNKFKISDGQFIMASYTLSTHQPTFTLSHCDLTLRNIKLPNPNRVATHFEFNGLLGTARSCTG